jgi:hypothetical protein
MIRMIEDEEIGNGDGQFVMEMMMIFFDHEGQE